MWPFKKEIGNVGSWFMVDWTDAAKEFSVGYNFNKVIHHMYDTTKYKEEDYSVEKELELKRQGAIVINLTEGTTWPMDSINVPRESVVFGTIQLFKRI